MEYIPPIGGDPDDPYIDGNPSGGVDGSVVPAAAIEDPQREIMNVITGASLTPDGGNLTQLRQAIVAMIQSAQRAVIIDAATFEGSVINGNAVYWDSANTRFDKAQADGTAKQNCVGFADVTNSKVYCFGSTTLFSGLTPGARYYLDAATAGQITTVYTAGAFVGIGRSATEVFVDIDGFVLPDASETVKGVVEIATDAEAQAYTANKAIDGAKLAAAFGGSNKSHSGASGYQKFPSGLIVQWGSVVTSAGAGVAVVFPVAFPSACRTVCLGAAQNTSVGATFDTLTATGMNVNGWTTSTGARVLFSSVYWIAIGN